MSSPSQFTKLKIILGSGLLLLFLFFSITFIREEMDNLSMSETIQENMTDSLILLLQEKDQNTIQMLRALSESNESLLSFHDIEEIISHKDSFITQQQVVQYRVVETRDSVLNPVPKKKFFKRLAEAFVPAKDTAVLLNSSVEYMVDTIVHEYNPIDSLQKRIQVMNEQKIERHQVIQQNNARLRRLNRQLTARIDSMIKRTEEQTLLHTKKETEQQQALRRESIRTLGGIAIGAILFAVFLLFLIWRDIVQSNRYRKELEEANKRAEELLVTREKLMLTITHDFKAPLGSIMGYADLLERLISDGRQKFYMHNIKTSSEHLLKLVNDLLEFHRLDLNKEQVERVPFNPVQLFNDVNVSFQPLASEKGLALQYEIEEELNGYFISDPLRVRQIVTNLLSNAIKFTLRGSVTLKVSYSSSNLCIIVSDTGVGIPLEDKERIFQEFTRLPGAQGEEGFGLGLSIVRKLIHLLEGTIIVESEEEKGTRFIVHLPLYPVSGYVPEDETENQEAISLAKNLRVLMIDDDKIQLSLTTAMLEQQNVSVTSCDTLDELLEHLRNETFDLLLTDIQMPAINGFDLIRLLRSSSNEQMKNIPVVAVTARSEMENEEFAVHGFAGSLHKPFSVKDLLEVIQKLSVSPILVDNIEISGEFSVDSSIPSSFEFSHLTAFTEDDTEAANAIMETFILETEKSRQYLLDAIEQENMNEISSIAHKILPVFTLLQANETVVLLKYLEQQKNEQFTEKVAETTKEVIDQMEIILNTAKKRMSDKGR